MRYLQDANPTKAQTLDQVKDGLAGLLVQEGRRLVKHEIARMQGKDAGKCQELLLSSRKSAGFRHGESLKTTCGKRLGHSLTHGFRRKAKAARPKGHLVKHRGLKQLRARVLSDHTHESGEFVLVSLIRGQLINQDHSRARDERPVG